MNTVINILLSLFLISTSVNVTALEIEHEWIQGGLIIGKATPGSTIKLLKRSAKVNAQGDFVVGLGRDIKSPIALVEVLPSGKEVTHSFAVKQRKYNEQRIDGVPQKTVDIPAEELPRIREESALIKKARGIDSPLTGFLQTFQWPTQGIITGVYGSRRIFNGQPRRPHSGVDIAAPQGTSVKAPVSGVVTLVHNDMFFSGGTIIMDHGHGVSSTFIHLHKTHVSVGDEVQQGDVIAEVGSTGRSTGPHLHWGMNWFNQRLDPQLLVGEMPKQ